MNATGARGRPRGPGARPRRTISPSSSGSNNGGAASESSAWPSLGGASTWVARTTSSAVSGSGGSRGSGSRSGSSSRSGTGPRLSPPASVPASARAAAVAGRRAMVALRLSVERRTARPVPAIPAPVTRTRPARVAPVTRISPATRRNTARMSAPRVESRCELAQNSAWPMTPPRRSKAAACQNCASGTGPGPMPSVPAASISVRAATRQMSPARSGRAGGRSSRMRMRPPATTSTTGTA